MCRLSETCCSKRAEHELLVSSDTATVERVQSIWEDARANCNSNVFKGIYILRKISKMSETTDPVDVTLTGSSAIGVFESVSILYDHYMGKLLDTIF